MTGERSGLFAFITRRPLAVLPPLVALLLLSLLGLARLEKDTRSDAFLAPDNPALVYRDLIRERFGLADPLLVALVGEAPGAIYRPEALRALAELTDAVAALDNIDPDRVTSLATESLILGDAAGMAVEPVLEPLPQTEAEAAAVAAAVADFPLFLGRLVGEDGRAALIVAELEDEGEAGASYDALLALVKTAALPPGIEAHVAGEGAIAGYLGDYIDADAQRLNPLAGVIIIAMIVLAFRRLAPALLALFMIIGAVAAALGTMAALGVPFYVITNALPVILIGIAVADTVHLCSHFFELQAENPRRDRKALVVQTLRALWLPVTITSLTTAAGFLGLYLAAYMPPFKAFGLYAALGVMAALFYSLFALPALMLLARLQVAQGFIDQRRQGRRDALARGMAVLGRLTLAYPKRVVLGYALIAVLGAWSASHLVVDADRIRLFRADEPIVQADRAINRYLAGTSTLDIVVETGAAEGLFEPSVLRRIEALQRYAETLPHVTGSSSIVDYLKQMNRVLNEGERAAYRLPDSREAVAQYLLLYGFSGDPSDFEQVVDYDYRSANVRLTLDHGGFLQISRVVEALEGYLAAHFDDTVRATQSGRVTLNYHWIHNIGDSHFRGLVVALLLVWAVASLSFRSTLAGVYALVPVCASVLLVYSFMVWRGLTLGVGTSMFAAVAIGLGVDFAIHTLSRLRTLQQASEGDVDMMFARFYNTTGRALLLNVLAVAAGFGVLIFSQVAQLADFGSIVMLSMGVSFLASVTLLPALLYLHRPGFLALAPRERPIARPVAVVLVILAIAALWLSRDARADAATPVKTPLTAQEVVDRVNAVPQGQQVTRQMRITTRDKRGRERVRDTVSYRRDYPDQRRQVLFFTAPANIRDTAVLTWDYADPASEDDQWLYLPALRKVRRIPAADRGDYFLGTDFSFEDMKLDGRLSADYDYALLPSGSDSRFRLRATPVSAAVAEELGYGRTETTVDAGNWVVMEVDFYDTDGEHLKTLRAEDIRTVDGIWTRHRLHMDNHQSGHSTVLEFVDVDYRSPVPERLFTQQALRRGP